MNTRPVPILFLIVNLLCGCMMTPVAIDPKFTLDSKPAYEDYLDYYALGFIGDGRIDIQKVCMDQKPYAVQRFFGPDDALIALVTLGVYTPMTVRVWCGN